MTDATYDEMYRQAVRHISEGFSVILDGTFRQRSRRKQASEIGRNALVPVVVFECLVDRSQQIARLEERYRRKTAASDGRPELLQFHESDWEAVDYCEADLVLRVDTSIPFEQLVSRRDFKAQIARLEEMRHRQSRSVSWLRSGVSGVT